MLTSKTLIGGLKTMSEVKTKRPRVKKRYRDIAFEVEALVGCCGIGVVFQFEEMEESNGYWGSPAIPLKHATKEAQAKACYKEILEKTEKGNTWGDDKFTTLLISLVSKYKTPRDGQEAQFPELAALLVKEGWKIDQQFVNPNHGNEVILYSKHFPERINKFLEEDGG